MADILSKVKNALGITGNYQDETLIEYIDEVKGYMSDAGVPEAILESKISAGVISRGVSDLWSYDKTEFSKYFMQRVTQLVYKIKTGQYICFESGDYGITFPVNITGVEISPDDKVVFDCKDLTKDYTGITNNCILITLTQEESESLDPGEYEWTLKLEKSDAVITLIKNGVLIVTGGKSV